MGRRIVAGRLLLDRTGLAERFGVVPSTISHWATHSGTPSFPEPVLTEGRRKWRDAVTADAWWVDHQAANRARFTPLDRIGNPDDLLDSNAVVRILHYRNHRSIPAALIALAEVHVDPTTGRMRRYWRRRTAWAYADQRADAANAGRPRI